MFNITNLIEKLDKVNPNYEIILSNHQKPKSFGSYRGYPKDLAFSSSDNLYWSDQGGEYEDIKCFTGCNNVLNDNPTVAEFLYILNNCTGYEAYKGGFHQINRERPLWYSEFGGCNEEIVYDIKIGDKKVILKLININVINIIKDIISEPTEQKIINEINILKRHLLLKHSHHLDSLYSQKQISQLKQYLK